MFIQHFRTLLVTAPKIKGIVLILKRVIGRFIIELSQYTSDDKNETPFNSSDSLPNSYAEYENAEPLAMLENSYKIIKDSVLDDLLNRLRKMAPCDFHKLVLVLFKKMGYSISSVYNSSGLDGLISAEISEDPLGLEIIYLQAKKDNDHSVKSAAVAEFINYINERRLEKGVFITTLTFSRSAFEYVARTDKKVALIDGKRLVNLMWDYNVGVNDGSVYKVKKLG